jgi:hypothetical protein
MKFFLPTFAAAAWMPHVEGDARWVLSARSCLEPDLLLNGTRA